MWVTSDGYIRHQLLPENHYAEARGDWEEAYKGRYFRCAVSGYYAWLVKRPRPSWLMLGLPTRTGENEL
ncbi:Atu4866 domain-containing protein [Aquisalimonas lutea]|uniref:Atu4866 domain-containing protein n=1 Tax=Aquisalimonas lutea TaxID=1327750 RepID=UPI00338EAAA9